MSFAATPCYRGLYHIFNLSILSGRFQMNGYTHLQSLWD